MITKFEYEVEKGESLTLGLGKHIIGGKKNPKGPFAVDSL